MVLIGMPGLPFLTAPIVGVSHRGLGVSGALGQAVQCREEVEEVLMPEGPKYPGTGLKVGMR